MFEEKLLRGKDFNITPKIKIHQPTLGEIYDFGEQKYFQSITSFTNTPSDFMSELDDIGVDFESISEFEFFAMLSQTPACRESKLLFMPHVDFSKFYPSKVNDNMVLVESSYDGQSKADSIVIDEYVYFLLSTCIREMHHLEKNIVKTGNKATKKYLINYDRERKERKEKEPYKSFLSPLIIALVNRSEFKSTYFDVWDLPIYFFMKCIWQIQRLDNAQHLRTGMFSGNIDTSKINKKDLEWF